VDMYRGIIQHGAYMTSFLRGQIQLRGLDKPIGLGRIYRVVDAARAPVSPPKLSTASSAELVSALSHPNGWRRDTAQRLLVERGNRDVVPALRLLARGGGDPIPRLHALWTLEGLGAVDPETIASMEGIDGLRAAAEALRGTTGPLISPVDGLVTAAERDPDVPDAMLADRELDFLEAIMSSDHWDDEIPGRAALLERTARRLGTEARLDRLTWLLELTASQAEAARWRQRALLRGLLELRDQRWGARPAALLKLMRSEDPEISRLAEKIREHLHWPGDERAEPVPPALVPLTADERSRFDRGRRQFVASCAGCHRRSGLGEEGGPPALVDSSLIQGPDERLVRIVLQGLEGPLRADGKIYRNLNMPAILNLSSEEIAEVLTYVRREWGHRADPVSVEKVRAIKKVTEDREDPWTQVELLKLR
ncbi:MAG TPA: cytochrome c, partial [Planctomycetota bacterium]|nr:cytochrome c [Planctomycetota bacterium]